MKLKGEVNVPAFFELRPDRLLINPNFEGYKLSLDTLPAYAVPLDFEVDHASPTDGQYTMQHVKLSTLSNHIHPDPRNPGSVYIIDTAWNVYKSSTSGERPGALSKCWTIPEAAAKGPGRFNITLVFPDEHHAICSDGCGTLYIVETGSRNSEGAEWKVLFHELLFEAKKTPQFLVFDAISFHSDFSAFDVLLLRIDERVEWKEFLEFHQDTFLSSSQHPFVSVLEWITFVNTGSTFKVETSRSLVGRSSVDYAAIEQNGTGLYIASEDPFYFAYDSKKPIEFSTAPKPSDSGTDEKPEDSGPDYVWYQSDADISLWFRLPEEARKDDLIVDLSVNDIHIEFKKQVMLSGRFFSSIKPSESVWTLESGKLEITVAKGSDGNWAEFVPGNSSGEKIEDPALVDQIHSQLAHMCSEKWGADPHNADVYDPQGLEECDEYPSFTAALIRIDLNLQRITHRASLDSHQWLFSVKVDPGQPSCLCIRHDVDAIVWQPQFPIEKQSPSGDYSLDWNCKHLATFSALGYLQAAKERKKFTLSAPDFSYAVICDDVKHIYVYRQPSPIENDLRNRKTGVLVSHVAKQQLISLEPPLEVMGAYAGSDFLFILTSKNLHLFRVNAPEDI